MADIIELYSSQVQVDLRADEIIYADAVNLYAEQVQTDLRADEITYPDPLGIYAIQVPTDPHIHFFDTDSITNIAPGPHLRDNGNRVSFPYPIFTAATGYSGTAKLSYAEVSALSSNPRISVHTSGSAITGITIDGLYDIDCL